MAYSGNVHERGSCRVTVAGAAAIIQNSGAFTGVVFNGVGDVTLTLDDDWRYSPRAVFDVCSETAVDVFFGVVRVAAGNTIQVLFFDDLGAPVDNDFMLSYTDVFLG